MPNRADTSLPRRRLAAVAFVDVVGYSALMASDEVRTHARWMTILNEIIRPKADRHHGKIVKSTGDGVLAEFASALDAVEWAEEVQKATARASLEDGLLGPRISLRISVHLGDIITTEDDIYGDGVNVAARLQEHAKPGGIVLSEAVRDLVRGTAAANARDLGQLQLKNIDRPMRAYALEPQITTMLHAVPARQDPLPSIAILPLQNLGGDPADDYFADGIVEDIVVSLASLKELFVIARASTLAYRGQQVDPREIGRALGVRYVVLGSVRRSPRLIRVSVQLCDTSTGANLWGETAETPPGDLFSVQDRIVQKIVAGIAPNVRTAELNAAQRKRPESFSSYDYMLRALDIINRLDRDAFPQGFEFFAKAMERDPHFAMPYAWAAWSRMLNIGQGWSQNPDDDMLQARALSTRAIELDGQNALGLAVYGHVQSFYFHEYDVALAYLERALLASPNCAQAWILTSATLSYVGCTEQAVRHAEQGLRLSPADRSLFLTYNILCIAHYANGDYAEAVKWGMLSASDNPSFTANLRILICSLVAAGRLDEAKRFAQELLKLEPDFRVSVWAQMRQPFREQKARAEHVARLSQVGLPP